MFLCIKVATPLLPRVEGGRKKILNCGVLHLWQSDSDKCVSCKRHISACRSSMVSFMPLFSLMTEVSWFVIEVTDWWRE